MNELRDIITHPLTAYAAGVVLIGMIAMRLLFRGLSRAEQRRRDHTEQRRGFEALITTTPVDNPQAQSRRRALENIHQRYRQIRHVVIATTLLLLIFLITLPLLGDLPAAYVSFVIGALTVVVGIAAKPVIENLMSGLVISLGQAVRIGDTVKIDDQYGTVELITLTYTIVKLWDWRRYVIPNSQLMQMQFLNYSLHDAYIWAHVEFHVAPDADLELVKELATDAMKASQYALGNEPPAFWVMGLGKESVRCWVAGWAESPSRAWMLNHEAATELCLSMRKHNIKAHVHQMNMHPPADVPA